VADRIGSLITRERTLTPGRVAIAGAVLALLALLGNNAGLAIIFASLVIPAAGLVELSRRDLFEHEPRWSSPAMLAWGIVVGLVMATIGSIIAAEWWIDGAPLNVGAAGFGGQAAEREGTPGFVVLLFNGIVLPALGVAVAVMGPYAMRRFPEFRNEVMDGFTLGAAAGCGLATGTTIVFVWPIISGGSSNGGSVADWTATVLGVLITRPIIFGLVVAFIGAGLWQVALSQRSADLFVPAGIGLGGAIVFVFGDLLVQPSGTRAELLWHFIVAAALVICARLVLGRALAQDRLAVPMAATQVVCPTCGSSTPAGTYCAVCGSALTNDTGKLIAEKARPCLSMLTIQRPPRQPKTLHAKHHSRCTRFRRRPVFAERTSAARIPFRSTCG
jgi:ribosomal protein L32